MPTFEIAGSLLSGIGVWLLSRKQALQDPLLFYNKSTLWALGRFGLVLWLGGYALILAGGTWPWWGRIILVVALQSGLNGLTAAGIDAVWNAFSASGMPKESQEEEEDSVDNGAADDFQSDPEATIVPATLVIDCPRCGQGLSVPQRPGARFRCPKCSHVFSE